MLRTVIIGGAIIASAALIVPGLLDGKVENDVAEARQVPSVSSVSLAQPSGRSVLMEPDGRGHFIGEFRLNGRTSEAMIDTGASVVAINRSTARRIGISPANSEFVHPVNTANGTVHAAPARIDRLEIGGIVARDVQAVVLDDAALSGTLIGMSFLNKLRRYQVENGRLLLQQ
ncbi:TIGR02281 family clan AA aspartic protease [Aliihoeflea sp. PC F10.4]